MFCVKCCHCLADVPVDAGILLYVEPQCPKCQGWQDFTVEDKINYLLQIRYEKENQV